MTRSLGRHDDVYVYDDVHEVARFMHLHDCCPATHDCCLASFYDVECDGVDRICRAGTHMRSPTVSHRLCGWRGSRQRRRPRQSSRVRRCPIAFVPGAAGGAMRACPPARSTTRSHSGPPRPIPDANSLPSASHQLSHGALPPCHARPGSINGAYYAFCSAFGRRTSLPLEEFGSPVSGNHPSSTQRGGSLYES